MVKTKKVPIEGGTRPNMNMFGAISAGMSVALVTAITKKNEINNVRPKKSAAATI
ncbi:MAG TPA: hypothetical protein VGE82_00985 [Nitrososphaera sp.]